MTETNLDAEVILGNIARAAHHLIHLRMPAGNNSHTRANGAAIGLGADAFDLKPGVFRTGVIAEKRRRLVHVYYRNVDVSVIVEIAEGSTAARPRFCYRWSSARTNIDKAPVAEVLV